MFLSYGIHFTALPIPPLLFFISVVLAGRDWEGQKEHWMSKFGTGRTEDQRILNRQSGAATKPCRQLEVKYGLPQKI